MYANGRRWSREWNHTDPTMLLIVAASRDTRYLELSCAELYIFGLRPGIAWFHPDVLHACNHGLITIGVMHARLINIDHPHEPSATATATRLRLRNVFNRVGVICTACVSLDEYTFAPGVISRETWARGHPSLIVSTPWKGDLRPDTVECQDLFLFTNKANLTAARPEIVL